MLSRASFLAVAFFALAVRLGFVTEQSLWIDEAFTASWCCESLPKMLGRIASEDRHPPLYCLLSYTIVRLTDCASCQFDSTGKCEISLRLVSVVSGAALIFVVSLIGMRIGGIACALLSASLLVLHPGAIRFSQEARPYMLYTFLSAFACLLWIEALNCGDRRSGTAGKCDKIRLSSVVAFCIVSLLSLYSCYMAFVPWLARVLCAGAQLRRRHNTASLHLLAADIAAMLALLFWLAFVLLQPNVMGTKVSPTETGVQVVAAFLMNDFVGYEYGLSQSASSVLTLTLIASITCAISVVSAVYMSLRSVTRYGEGQDREALMLMLTWLVIHLALLLIAPLLIHEFNRWQRVIDGIVPLSLLLACNAATARSALSSLHKRLIVANTRLTIAILLILHCIGTHSQFNDSRYFREDWRGAAQFAMAHEREFEFIILNAPVGSFPFKLYYNGQREYKDAPSLVTEAERAAATTWLRNLLNRHRRILVIECRLWQVDPTGWLSAQLQRIATPRLTWHSSKISATIWEVKSLGTGIRESTSQIVP
ncbi:MAG: hypothetical protein RMK18_07785 [Armatimonadota bacterium]|nr:hypothetical protein [Armatimonadota bacterium]MCX7778065.1 hypothetical protein [Armatimonadota bacterium]MDW8025744.1 hypothetical protein [Armatimonadota bacterium]